MSTQVKEIDDQGFDSDVLQSTKPILVDFWAPWCGPCKAIGPIVEDLAQEYVDQMDFAKFNVDANPVTPGNYGIKAIPTIAIFKDGKPYEMIVGLTSRDRLETSIKNVLEGVQTAQPFIAR